VVEDLPEQRGRGADIARLERGLGGLERLIDRRWAGGRASEQPIHERLDLTLGQGAHESVHRPAVLEGVHGRNRLDSHLLGELGIGVDVDLDQAHGTPGRRHRLLEQRTELLARAAPWRPEVHYHGDLARRLDHVGDEVGGVALLDQFAIGPGRPAAEDLFHMRPTNPFGR